MVARAHISLPGQSQRLELLKANLKDVIDLGSREKGREGL